MVLQRFLAIGLSLFITSFTIAEESKSETKKGKERPNIAVSEFDVTEGGGVSKAVAVIVSDAVRDALFNTRRFVVVDRAAMDVILQEQAFQKSGCTTAECAVEIGKILNVKFMIIGSIGLLEDDKGSGKGEYTITVRVVEVETGQTKDSKSLSVMSQTALRKAAQEVALLIVPGIGGEAISSGGDSGGFVQDLLTVIGVVGAFFAAAFGSQ